VPARAGRATIVSTIAMMTITLLRISRASVSLSVSTSGEAPPFRYLSASLRIQPKCHVAAFQPKREAHRES
jgi:hypothetical protein